MLKFTGKFQAQMRSAARRNNLSVALDGKVFFVSTGIWMLKAPTYYGKVASAVGEAAGMLKDGESKGSHSLETLLHIWKLHADVEQEPVRLTDWMYRMDNPPVLAYVLRSEERVIVVDSDYLDMFGDISSQEMTMPRNNLQGPVILYDGDEPYFMVMPLDMGHVSLPVDDLHV